jgi:hypothetical protein
MLVSEVGFAERAIYVDEVNIEIDETRKTFFKKQRQLVEIQRMT